MNLFWTIGRTSWTGDQPVARPLPTQDSTTQENANTHPYLERDSNPLLKRSCGPRPYVQTTTVRTANYILVYEISMSSRTIICRLWL